MLEEIILHIQNTFPRLLGAFSLFPWNGGPWKAIGIAALLTLAVPAEHTLPLGLLGVATEFLTGLLIAAPIFLIVSAVASWGEFFDLGRGASIASLFDPTQQVNRSQSAELARQYIWILFLLAGALPVLTESLIVSFDLIPPGKADNFLVQGRELLRYATTFLASAMSLFLPMALIFFCIDLSFGFVAKAIPGMNFHSETFQIKTTVGFLLLIALHGSGLFSSISGSLEGGVLLAVQGGLSG